MRPAHVALEEECLRILSASITLAGGESVGQSLSHIVPQYGREESPGSIGQSAR